MGFRVDTFKPQVTCLSECPCSLEKKPLKLYAKCFAGSKPKHDACPLPSCKLRAVVLKVRLCFLDVQFRVLANMTWCSWFRISVREPRCRKRLALWGVVVGA